MRNLLKNNRGIKKTKKGEPFFEAILLKLLLIEAILTFSLIHNWLKKCQSKHIKGR